METHAAHYSLHQLHAVFILLLALRMASSLGAQVPPFSDLPLDRHSLLGDLVGPKIGRKTAKVGRAPNTFQGPFAFPAFPPAFRIVFGELLGRIR